MSGWVAPAGPARAGPDDLPAEDRPDQAADRSEVPAAVGRVVHDRCAVRGTADGRAHRRYRGAVRSGGHAGDVRCGRRPAGCGRDRADAVPGVPAVPAGAGSDRGAERRRGGGVVSDLTFLSWQRSRLYDLVADPAPKDGRLVGPAAAEPCATCTARTWRRGRCHFTWSRRGTSPRSAAGRSSDGTGARWPATRRPPSWCTSTSPRSGPALAVRASDRGRATDCRHGWCCSSATTDELRIDGPTVAVLQPSVLTAHDLAGLASGGHTSRTTGTGARPGCCHRAAGAGDEYLAVVVPGFRRRRPAGLGPGARQPPATPAGAALLAVLDRRGGRLRDARLPDHATAGRRARAGRRWRTSAGTWHVDLQVRGAITTLGIDPDGDPEAAARADLAAFVAESLALPTRWDVGWCRCPPTGGRGWPTWPRPTWTATLNTDPRYRGTAGLGLWMGIEAQDELVDAASRQLGALGLAGHLVGQLALGLTAARSLWNRRLPDDPVAAAGHVRPADAPAAHAVRHRARARSPAGASPLEAALFSSASRRVLRRGTAWTRHTATGFVGRPALIAAANACPRRGGRRHPAGVPAPGRGHRRRSDCRRCPNLRDRIVRDPPTVDPDHRLDLGLVPRVPRPGLLPRGEALPCAPPDLGRIAGVVGAAIDPNGPDTPALRRVRARISGVDIGTLEPPELPVGLDFPTWTLLRDRAKEWILPGIGTLEKHSVVAMQTNPTFIDAYLVGVNTQLQNELHWRNLPVDRRSTPLLMFWGHVELRDRAAGGGDPAARVLDGGLRAGRPRPPGAAARATPPASGTWCWSSGPTCSAATRARWSTWSGRRRARTPRCWPRRRSPSPRRTRRTGSSSGRSSRARWRRTWCSSPSTWIRPRWTSTG